MKTEKAELEANEGEIVKKEEEVKRRDTARDQVIEELESVHWIP